MTKLILIVIFVLTSPIANALNELSLSIKAISADNWRLEGINGVADLAENPQKLTLSIQQLNLPKPFHDLSSATIACSSFNLENNGLLCRQGQAEIHAGSKQLSTAHFSFFIAAQRLWFKSTNIKLAGGTIAVDAQKTANQWRVRINAKNIKAGLLEKWLHSPLFEAKDGIINLTLNADGKDNRIEKLNVTAKLGNISGQSQDGRFASENLTLYTKLDARIDNGLWQWQGQAAIDRGDVYLEPVYLKTGGENIMLDAQGNWNAANQKVQLTSAHYSHASAIDLNGEAIISYDNGVKLELADISVSSNHLEKLSSIYLKPLLEQTALEGLALAGDFKADVSIANQTLTSLTATVNHLAVSDSKNRLELKGGAGTVNWSDHAIENQLSSFAWRQLQVYALPVGPAKLSFQGDAQGFRLLEKASLPFLDGDITIQQFGWQAKTQHNHAVYFAGDLNNISLEQLSNALKWRPLSGNINGSIPKIEYSNDTLSLDGELIIKVFDGEIKITNIASSGLFSDFPRFYSELEIDRLDLEQLTSTFEFGGITGKLSGFIRQLTLENWKPVSFYAWFGTPDDDDSIHKISQKAVKNITRLGGGGVSDLLSRSFLNLFETFSYAKIGLGCYLHNGVCQLMGVEATESGYAIIKGGGLPRIDVIGYNPRLDWQVLMERLSRITASNEVIIE
ncbi:MAG: C4-dicarboxylate ABC transporter [Methylococcaceae bacterium]